MAAIKHNLLNYEMEIDRFKKETHWLYISELAKRPIILVLGLYFLY